MNLHLGQKLHFEVLKEKFGTLAVFYEQLLNSESNINFFRIVSENIVPLIKGSARTKPLYEKW